jgi:kinetochore protein NNF1
MPPETNSPSVNQSSTFTLPNPGSPESPQLERPTASAPGPRAALFQKLYDKALDSTLKTISYENFAACFPTVAKTNDVGLREMHAGFVGKLGEFSRVSWISSV